MFNRITRESCSSKQKQALYVEDKRKEKKVPLSADLCCIVKKQVVLIKEPIQGMVHALNSVVFSDDISSH